VTTSRDLGPTAPFLARVGQEVRRRRQGLDLTVAQLAERSGLSRAMLTQVELGQANPSLMTVDKLARALGVDFATLAGAADRNRIAVKGPDEAVVVWTSPAGSSGRLRIAGSRQGGQELWEWVLLPGDQYSAEPDPPGSEELVLVRSGTLTIVVEDEAYTLGPGTAARLATDNRYGYRNHGSEPVRFVRTTRIAS
jgi:transcriptional regulator with XRE-family HTH domain